MRFTSSSQRTERSSPMPSRRGTPTTSRSAFFASSANTGLGYVFLEGYYMPHIADVFSKHDTSTKASTIVRLHGPRARGNGGGGEGRWDRLIEPRPAMNRKNGALNPNARFQKPVTIEEVLASRIIAKPLRLLHSCPWPMGTAVILAARRNSSQRPR